MREKIRHRLCQTADAVILAGGIIFFIGLYYWIVKAGIPYQDPPLELQVQYAVNSGIGSILTGKGFLIALCGGADRLFLGVYALLTRAPTVK